MLSNFIAAIFICFGCANDDESRLMDDIIGRYQENPEWFDMCEEEEATAHLERFTTLYGTGFSKGMFTYAQCTSPSFLRLRQLFEAFPAEFQRYTPEQIDQKIIADKDNRRFALSILSDPDVENGMVSLQDIFQQMAAKLATIEKQKKPDFIEMCFRQVYTGDINLSIYPDDIWSNIPDWGRPYLKLAARMSLLTVFIGQLSYDRGCIPLGIQERQLKEINFCLRLIAE
jgi:hypothetical protein